MCTDKKNCLFSFHSFFLLFFSIIQKSQNSDFQISKFSNFWISNFWIPNFRIFLSSEFPNFWNLKIWKKGRKSVKFRIITNYWAIGILLPPCIAYLQVVTGLVTLPRPHRSMVPCCIGLYCTRHATWGRCLLKSMGPCCMLDTQKSF